MIKINMNRWVTVKLTETGKKRADEIKAQMEKVLKQKIKDRYDGDGIYTTQLWMLVRDFGDMIDMANMCPFENCELVFEEEDKQ